MKSYCTQNNGNCETCSLANYGKDCQNNPLIPRNKQSQIIFRVPTEIKKQLQLKVLQEGTTVQQLFENYTNNYLKENEK